jgi:glycosyltransferase involved in cell wall biosynthesis
VKVALVHDYLTQRGGAERVFLALCRAFPNASIFTSVYEPELTFPEFAQYEIQTTSLNRMRAFRRHHRLALPFLAPALSRLEVDADLTICSSSGWAHGVHATGHKVVYCYNPARWLYQTDQYTGRRRSAGAAAIRFAGDPLRRWDRRSAHSADAYLVVSNVVRGRVHTTYGIDSEVVPPPLTIDPTGAQTPISGHDDGFYLCVSRLLRYKNVEAIVNAFARLPHERLVVVGSGPMERQLRSILPANVTLAGTVDESQLRWLYAHSRALVAASYEDFGLTPIEAMAFGKPSVVLRWGGFLETVTEGETGVFFDEPTDRAIAGAVGEVRRMHFDPDVLRARAQEYAESRFAEHVRSAIARTVANERSGVVPGALEPSGTR